MMLTTTTEWGRDACRQLPTEAPPLNRRRRCTKFYFVLGGGRGLRQDQRQGVQSLRLRHSRPSEHQSVTLSLPPTEARLQSTMRPRLPPGRHDPASLSVSLPPDPREAR